MEGLGPDGSQAVRPWPYEMILFNLLFGLFQVLLLLALAPLVQGVIKKVKARLQSRRGPSLFQPYFDLVKFLRKDQVVSEPASWIFHATPYISLTSVLAAGAFIPVIGVTVPFSFAGDGLVVVYLFAVMRFFMALVGLDTGSAFGGMASSREMMVASLAEPALLLSLFTLALTAGSLNLSGMVQKLAGLGVGTISPSYLLAFVALILVTLAETGRIPVDNPTTHLELTMIHEGMILEYSGKYLALMEWSAWIKQLILFTLLANLFVPWGAHFLWYLPKVLVLATGIACIESSVAKLRLFRVPDLLAVSNALSILALVSVVIGR